MVKLIRLTRENGSHYISLLTLVLFIHSSDGKVQSQISNTYKLDIKNTQEYYIDSKTGHDNNNGTTPETAWRTLEKINMTTFKPGTKILFKSGRLWIGQLKLNGSGSERKPIIIDKYGEGAKPIINANGKIGAVLSLHNESFWEINNLELINDAPEEGLRNGVNVTAKNVGIVKHIHLKDLYIHNIRGIVGDNNLTSGIFIQVLSDDKRTTRFDGVLIENCEIAYVENQGISTRTPGRWENVGFNDPGSPDWERRKFTNLIIRNNFIHHISKNAIIIRMADKGLVEHNVCYATALKVTGNTMFTYGSRGTVFQYNEGYLNMSPSYDGSMYDADRGSPKTIWQYSYSHNNKHGLIWLIPYKNSDSIVVRYNISQNDKGNLVTVTADNNWSAFIYNNTFYIDKSLSPTIIHEYYDTDKSYHFYNNIIYNLSPTSTYTFVSSPKIKRYFSNNVFYGYHPDNEPMDSFKVIQDPLFMDPGSGKIGLNTVEGYKLRSGSPAIGMGRLIKNNGGLDYFGLVVSDTGSPNIGAYNGKGINTIGCLKSDTAQFHNVKNGTWLRSQPPNEKILFMINGLEVTDLEFERVLSECKTVAINEILMKHDINDLEELKKVIKDDETLYSKVVEEGVLDKLVEYKVVEMLLRQRNLWNYDSYNQFINSIERINTARIKKKNTGDIIFGPILYTENTFWDYKFSNAIIKLKEKLMREGLLSIKRDVNHEFDTLIQNKVKEVKVTSKMRSIVKNECQGFFY